MATPTQSCSNQVPLTEAEENAELDKLVEIVGNTLEATSCSKDFELDNKQEATNDISRSYENGFNMESRLLNNQNLKRNESGCEKINFIAKEFRNVYRNVQCFVKNNTKTAESNATVTQKVVLKIRNSTITNSPIEIRAKNDVVLQFEIENKEDFYRDLKENIENSLQTTAEQNINAYNDDFIGDGQKNAETINSESITETNLSEMWTDVQSVVNSIYTTQEVYVTIEDSELENSSITITLEIMQSMMSNMVMESVIKHFHQIDNNNTNISDSDQTGESDRDTIGGAVEEVSKNNTVIFVLLGSVFLILLGLGVYYFVKSGKARELMDRMTNPGINNNSSINSINSNNINNNNNNKLTPPKPKPVPY